MATNEPLKPWAYTDGYGLMKPDAIAHQLEHGSEHVKQAVKLYTIPLYTEPPTPAAIPTGEGLDDAVRSAMVDVERIARENPRDSDSWGRGATHIANLAMPIVNALIARLASSTGAQAEEAKPLAPDGLIGKMPEFLRHAETRDLEALIVHCWVHSGYRDCGREQMGEAERILYDDIISRAEQISALPKPEARPEGDGCAVCLEAAAYLDTHKDTTIGSGSILHQKFRDALRSPGAGAWRPMETAPRDGTRILIATKGTGIQIGFWVLPNQIPDRARNAMHWGDAPFWTGGGDWYHMVAGPQKWMHLPPNPPERT